MNEHEGLIHNLGGIDLKLHIRNELRHWDKQVVKYVRSIPKVIRLIDIIFLISLCLLGVLIITIYRRHARNQIALAHLAHAVKTPVARLKLAAETLTEGRVASPEEEQSMLHAVTRECDRLDRAVQNAALSLERGRLEFDLQTGDFSRILYDLSESWKPTFEKQKIELKNEVPASLKIAFDHVLLPVAIDNLIDNALRHTRLRITPPTPPAIAGGDSDMAGSETPPSVTISLIEDSGFAILRIDDSGEGIPKSARSKLFKPFSGSATDPKSGVGGLGLGLALVKRIVEGHKGTVSVAEAPSGGARFEVRLPVNK